MPIKVNLVGRRFGSRTVLARAPNNTRGQSHWLVRCDCGDESAVRGDRLLAGRSRTCQQCDGRNGRDVGPKGFSRFPEYVVWAGMIARCEYQKGQNFHRYGGRGITVCERWRKSFLAFLEDMGRRPAPHLTLDRINNDGNYEPGNVRWATRKEQMSNRRPRAEWRKAS